MSSCATWGKPGVARASDFSEINKTDTRDQKKKINGPDSFYGMTVYNP